MHKKILKKIFLASSLIAPVAIVTPIVLTSCSTSDTGGGDSTNPPSGDKTEIGLVGKSLTPSGSEYVLTGKLKGSGDDFKDETAIKSWLTDGDSLKTGGFEKLLGSVDGNLKNGSSTTINPKDDISPEKAEEVSSKVVVTTKSTKEDTTTFSGTIEVTLSLKDNQKWSNNLDEKPIKFTLTTDGVDNPDDTPSGETLVGFDDDTTISESTDKGSSKFFFFYLNDETEMDKSEVIKGFSQDVMVSVEGVVEGLLANGFKEEKTDKPEGSTRAKTPEFKAVLKNENFDWEIVQGILEGLKLKHGILTNTSVTGEIDVEFSKFKADNIKDNVKIEAEIGLNRYGFTFDLNLTPKDSNKFEWQKGSGTAPLNIYMEKELKGVYFIDNLDEFKATEVTETGKPFTGAGADTQKKQEYKFTGENSEVENIDETFTKIENVLKNGLTSDGKSDNKAAQTGSDTETVDKVNIDGLKKLLTDVGKLTGTAASTGGKDGTSSSTKELKLDDIHFDNLTENDENVNPVKATLTKSKSSNVKVDEKDTITVKIEISLKKDSYWLTSVKDTDAKKDGEAEAPTKNSTPITIELTLKKKTTTGSGKGF